MSVILVHSLTTSAVLYLAPGENLVAEFALDRHWREDAVAVWTRVKRGTWIMTDLYLQPDAAEVFGDTIGSRTRPSFNLALLLHGTRSLGG